MSVVGIVSMKGGVGKTSITANLAAALASLLGPGRVSAVDLDPQNALHWHLGLTAADADGVCEHALAGSDWRSVLRPTPYGVACLSYGAGEEAHRGAFEAMLANDPGWLGRQIEQSGLGNNAVVLIDTPPGPSVYLKQVFASADVVLIVVLPDGGSYATIPAMESWLDEAAAQRPGMQSFYVLNQLDSSEPLNRDVAEVLRQRLGSRLAPAGIHGDEAVREALAFQQPVLAYDPHGQASHELAQLATWLIDTLNR